MTHHAHARAVYTNPADHCMDMLTAQLPLTTEPGCPPVQLAELLPNPDDLKALYKHVQVGLCVCVLVAEGRVCVSGAARAQQRAHAWPCRPSAAAPYAHSSTPQNINTHQHTTRMLPAQVDLAAGAATPLRAVRKLVPWHRQFRVLLARAFKEQARKKGVIVTQLLQAVVMAVLIGTVFLQVRASRVLWCSASPRVARMRVLRRRWVMLLLLVRDLTCV